MPESLLLLKLSRNKLLDHRVIVKTTNEAEFPCLFGWKGDPVWCFCHFDRISQLSHLRFVLDSMSFLPVPGPVVGVDVTITLRATFVVLKSDLASLLAEIQLSSSSCVPTPHKT